jgi:hypothetical protein
MSDSQNISCFRCHFQTADLDVRDVEYFVTEIFVYYSRVIS